MKNNVLRTIMYLLGICLRCSVQAASPEKLSVQGSTAAAVGVDECPLKLDGYYGFVAAGTVPMRQADDKLHPASLQELGEVRYFADQTAALRVKITVNGSIADRSLSGKYSINTKTCAGSVKWTDPKGDGFTWGFVVVSKGLEILTMDLRGEGTKESPASSIVFTQSKL